MNKKKKLMSLIVLLLVLAISVYFLHHLFINTYLKTNNNGECIVRSVIIELYKYQDYTICVPIFMVDYRYGIYNTKIQNINTKDFKYNTMTNGLYYSNTTIAINNCIYNIMNINEYIINDDIGYCYFTYSNLHTNCLCRLHDTKVITDDNTCCNDGKFINDFIVKFIFICFIVFCVSLMFIYIIFSSKS